MRGTKLLAWRFPPIFSSGEFSGHSGSTVPYMQRKLYDATLYALAAVAADVKQGLLETVGLESEWWTDSKERASVVVYLPATADAEYVARAVNLENLEAWLDEKKRFHAAISPYYTTKDVDQVVLCIIKVVHQYTPLIGIDEKTHDHSHSCLE